MALYKYLKPVSEPISTALTPDSSRKDSLVANQPPCQVVLVPDKGRGATSRSEYIKLSLEKKAEIGKYASENGVAKAARHYKDLDVKESSVRDWRDAYLKEIRAKRKEAKPGEEIVVTKLPCKKRGRPVLIGEKFDKHLQEKLIALRHRGTPIGTSAVIGVGLGILKKHKSTGDPKNKLNKEWARSVLRRMGFTKRRACSKSKITPENFVEIKEQFLIDIEAVIDFKEVPPSLVINWDHTAMKIVPSSQWMMEKRGTKRVEIAGIDDKRQITAVFACTMSGRFLPMQLIYKGTTRKCLPKRVDFPSDWDVTFTANHWANESTTVSHLKNVIVPYIKQERKALKLSDDHCALALFDVFKGQCTSEILKILEENNILFVTVPNNCTDRLQPLDLAVNKPAKDFVRAKFQDWYGDEICKQLEKGVNEDVDMRMSCMKPLTAQWMIDLHGHLAARPDIILNGFRAAGILNSK